MGHFIFMLLIERLQKALNPLFRWIYKYDIEYNEGKISSLEKYNKEKREKIEELETLNRKYLDVDKNIRSIICRYNWNYIEITDKGEPVILSFDKIDLRNTDIYLNRIYINQDSLFCAKIDTLSRDSGRALDLLTKVGINIPIEQWENIIYISCLQSKIKRKGYGTALINFLFRFAREPKYKYIIGWISHTSEEDHSWLAPYYKEIGFDVYMFEREGVFIKDFS